MSAYVFEYYCNSQASYVEEGRDADIAPVVCNENSGKLNIVSAAAQGTTGGASFTQVVVTGHPFSNGDTVAIAGNNVIPDGTYVISNVISNEFEINVTFTVASTTQGTVSGPWPIASTTSGGGGNTQVTINGHPFSDGDTVVIDSAAQITNGNYTVSNSTVNTFDVNFTYSSDGGAAGTVSGVHSIIASSITIIDFPVPQSNQSYDGTVQDFSGSTVDLTTATIVGLDHDTDLDNVGTNTHAQIDTHISSTAVHGVTENTITTTDNTTTTISTIATSSNITYWVTLNIVGRRIDSLNDDYKGFRFVFMVTNDGGTLDPILTDKISMENGIGSDSWEVTIISSGTNILVQVTGENSKTINWKSRYEITSV